MRRRSFRCLCFRIFFRRFLTTLDMKFSLMLPAIYLNLTGNSKSVLRNAAEWICGRTVFGWGGPAKSAILPAGCLRESSI